MKKLISIVLAAAILFSLAIPAFAESSPDDLFYFSIGDSVARGCGLNSDLYTDDKWNNFGSGSEYTGGNNIPGSYPQLVASALSNGAKESADASFHYRGMRTVETYYGLGGDVSLWEFDNYFDLYFKWTNESMNAYRRYYQDAAGKADVITLQIGANDIVYSSALRSGAMSSVNAETVSKCVEYMWEGYNNFCTYYPKIVDRILELQREEKGTDQDVTILLLGYYNAFADAPLTDVLYLPVGDAYAFISDRMNAVIQGIADKYEQAVYVDISATQTPITAGSQTVLDALNNGSIVEITHPSAEGYAYIARQILNALPYGQAEEYPNTYIRLNLNKPFTVTGVTLGVLPVSGFTQSDDLCELIVPSISPLHKLLTVTGKDENGNRLVFTYTLDYQKGSGYTTHLESGTYDFAKWIDRVILLPLNLIRSLIGMLKK